MWKLNTIIIFVVLTAVKRFLKIDIYSTVDHKDWFFILTIKQINIKVGVSQNLSKCELKLVYSYPNLTEIRITLSEQKLKAKYDAANQTMISLVMICDSLLS